MYYIHDFLPRLSAKIVDSLYSYTTVMEGELITCIPLKGHTISHTL